MFYFIIAIILAVVACYFAWADTDSWFLGIIGGIFVGVIVFFISTTIGWLVASDYDTPNSSTQNIIYEEAISITALKDNMGVSGNTYLFSSSVNEKVKYNYITIDEFGQHINNVDAEKCYIVYGDKPSIQEFHNESKSKIVNWLFSPSRTFYLITLPEGSVIENEYKIDLE